MNAIELGTFIAWFGGICMGVGISCEIVRARMQKAAVKAGAGHYNPQTGKFHFGPFVTGIDATQIQPEKETR